MRHLFPLLADSVFVVLASYFVINYVHSFLIFNQFHAADLIFGTSFLVFQLIALTLLLVRRGAVSISTKTTDYIYTVAALASPLFFLTTSEISVSIFGVFLGLVGTVLVIGAFLSLNRSFGIGPENRGIKTNGLYRVIRHPMYLGYILTEIGFVINFFSLFNSVVLVTATVFLLLRLNSEERFLREDRTYREYANNTPWKLVPFVF